MPSPVRVGEHLAYVSEAMRVTHEKVCRRYGDHRWESCPATPSLFATGDALDLLDLGCSPGPVASAMHARMCGDGECGMAEAMEHAQRAYLPTAKAMYDWHTAHRSLPETTESYLAMCECDHILRGHSLDKKRCFTPGCSCTFEGGFRIKDA